MVMTTVETANSKTDLSPPLDPSRSSVILTLSAMTISPLCLLADPINKETCVPQRKDADLSRCLQSTTPTTSKLVALCGFKECLGLVQVSGEYVPFLR